MEDPTDLIPFPAEFSRRERDLLNLIAKVDLREPKAVLRYLVLRRAEELQKEGKLPKLGHSSDSVRHYASEIVTNTHIGPDKE